MNATLVVVGGRTDKRQLKIELPAVLGRSRQADVTIAQSLISRQHCELREHEGGVLLVDLDSLNGTYFGTRKVRRVVLRPNDRFSIGSLTFEIRYELSGVPNRPGRSTSEQGSTGGPVELGEPVGTQPVELDESVQSEVSDCDRRDRVDSPEVLARRKCDLPGFGHREDLLDYEEEGGETIAIDPASGFLGSDSSPFDSPTSRGDAPHSGGSAGQRASERDDSLRES